MRRTFLPHDVVSQKKLNIPNKKDYVIYEKLLIRKK